MFTCEKCAKKKNVFYVPFMESYGACEWCRKVTGCQDIPSTAFPLPKPKEIPFENLSEIEQNKQRKDNNVS